MKVWGAFQNPLVPEHSFMLLFLSLVVMVLGSLLKPNVKVMGSWKKPLYLMRAKGALLKPLDLFVLTSLG